MDHSFIRANAGAKSLSFRYLNIPNKSDPDVTLIPTAKVAGKGAK